MSNAKISKGVVGNIFTTPVWCDQDFNLQVLQPPALKAYIWTTGVNTVGL